MSEKGDKKSRWKKFWKKVMNKISPERKNRARKEAEMSRRERRSSEQVRRNKGENRTGSASSPKRGGTRSRSASSPRREENRSREPSPKRGERRSRSASSPKRGEKRSREPSPKRGEKRSRSASSSKEPRVKEEYVTDPFIEMIYGSQPSKRQFHKKLKQWGHKRNVPLWAQKALLKQLEEERKKQEAEVEALQKAQAAILNKSKVRKPIVGALHSGDTAFPYRKKGSVPKQTHQEVVTDQIQTQKDKVKTGKQSEEKKKNDATRLSKGTTVQESVPPKNASKKKTSEKVRTTKSEKATDKSDEEDPKSESAEEEEEDVTGSFSFDMEDSALLGMDRMVKMIEEESDQEREPAAGLKRTNWDPWGPIDVLRNRPDFSDKRLLENTTVSTAMVFPAPNDSKPGKLKQKKKPKRISFLDTVIVQEYNGTTKKGIKEEKLQK